jgi:hypothetical protein
MLLYVVWIATWQAMCDPHLWAGGPASCAKPRSQDGPRKGR